METLAAILEGTVASYPTKVFLNFEDVSITYKAFDDEVNRLGNSLKHLGVKKGDRIGLFLPSCLDLITGYFATLKIGAIVVLLNYMLKTPEVKHILKNSSCSTVITDNRGEEMLSEILPELEDLKHIIIVGKKQLKQSHEYSKLVSEASSKLKITKRTASDEAAIMYTSGTTGLPKGAVLSHLNLIYGILINTELLGFSNSSNWLTGLPMFNDMGLHSTLLPAVYNGSTLTLLRKFDAEKALQLIETSNITNFAGVPTMYSYMLEAYNPNKHKVNSLKIGFSAGGAASIELIEEFEKTFNIKYRNCYGLTEARIVTGTRLADVPRRGSLGSAAPGQIIKLVDDQGNEIVEPGVPGEAAVRSIGVFKGYWKMPEVTKKSLHDGWLFTMDVLSRDQDGFYYFVDRKADLIVCGGFNIYPKEVEDVICTHPDVMMAGVVGIPDKVKDEVPRAYVVLKEGKVVSESDIIAYAKSKLATYKAPRDVKFVKELPLGPGGKILKRELRAQARQENQPAVH